MYIFKDGPNLKRCTFGFKLAEIDLPYFPEALQGFQTYPRLQHWPTNPFGFMSSPFYDILSLHYLGTQQYLLYLLLLCAGSDLFTPRCLMLAIKKVEVQVILLVVVSSEGLWEKSVFFLDGTFRHLVSGLLLNCWFENGLLSIFSNVSLSLTCRWIELLVTLGCSE